VALVRKSAFRIRRQNEADFRTATLAANNGAHVRFPPAGMDAALAPR
jgi:hypothetical protein